MPWKKMFEKFGDRSGSIAKMGLGAVQGIQGMAAKKRALDATPSDVDPTQGAFLAELQQKRNALNSGAQYTSSIDAIRDKMVQTQTALGNNSGGDAGGTVSAMLKSQAVANQGVGGILAQAQQAEAQNTGMYGNMLDNIAQRKMELGLLARGQNMAKWAQKSQNASSNFMGGLAEMVNVEEGGVKQMNTGGQSSQGFMQPSGQAGIQGLPQGVGAGMMKAPTGGGGAAGGGGGMGGILQNFTGGGGGGAAAGGGGGAAKAAGGMFQNMDFGKAVGMVGGMFGG